MDGDQAERIATDLLALLGSGRQTDRIEALDLPGAYQVVARVRALREARGERPVGRKIAFTNTMIWPRYGLTAPTWNYVFDGTLHALAETRCFALAGLPEPRIEPEIVLHLARAPQPCMDEAALAGCVDRVAHGFEIVQSVFPGWVFSGAEVAAAFGLHGALLVGPWHGIEADRATWAERLGAFTVTLARNGAPQDAGRGANVLGGPFSALRFLVEEIARHPGCAPLAAGEIVTTGTLTDAQPVRPGETWTTALAGIPIAGLEVSFA